MYKRQGLTEEELAFYNAIALPENIHDFYDDETLIKITQESVSYTHLDVYKRQMLKLKTKKQF